MASETKDRPIGILTSVRQEMVAVARLLNPISMFERNGVSYYHGEIEGIPVLLTHSGMGWERAERAAKALIRDGSPKSLIIAGFAASLSPDVKRGEVVIPNCVKTSIHLTSDAPPLIPSIPTERMIEQSLIHTNKGGLITHNRIVVQAGEKQKLANEYPNCASLDMESYPMARQAEGVGVPWMVVRGITDDINEDMPLDFNRYIGADGETATAKVAMAVCLRFWKIPALIDFGKNAQKTANSIAEAVKTLITYT